MIKGTFDRSIQAARWAREAGLSLQINSLACTSNIDDLTNIAALVEELGADMWELMFLIPTGRGSVLEAFTPEECERAFEIIYEIERRVDFVVKVTEAPHYRRFLIEKGHDASRLHRVNAGRGFVFISHVGEVFPSGFLPMSVGDVRSQSITEIYRTSPDLVALRDPDQIHGACGECGYRLICGGSRSRAHAVTGDAFASEPWCIRA
jgi:radical SAM protein with 4Fe4S-binding SPASM domain